MARERSPRRPRISRAFHPTDINLGTRIRGRRKQLGWSQERLARVVGVTFQQVQKYERGASRISASMLEAIAEALDAPISYFFDRDDDPLATTFSNPLTSAETRELVHAYYALPPMVRAKLLAFMRAAAEQSRPRDDHESD